MISRVGAALAQFIAPVASSQAQEQIHTEDNNQGRPSGQKRERKQAPAQAKTPASATPLKPVAVTAAPTPPATPSAGIGTSGAQSFLQLLDVFQHGRGMFMRFFGTRSYQQSVKGQKKAGKFKKGTMLDERIE